MCLYLRERDTLHYKLVSFNMNVYMYVLCSDIARTLHYMQELQGQLHSAMREVDDLREARERQKEMVSAVVKQRDMYRTLLAQSTPLPGDIVTPPRSKVASAATREGRSLLPW